MRIVLHRSGVYRTEYLVDGSKRIVIDDDGTVLYDGTGADLVKLLDRARADDRPVIVLPDADHDRDANNLGIAAEHGYHHVHLADGRARYHRYSVLQRGHDHHATYLDDFGDPGHRH